MNDCPTARQLERLLAGDLPAAEEQAVTAHVESCARCQEVLERLTAVGDADITPLHRGDPKDVLRRLGPLLPDTTGAGSPAVPPAAVPDIPGYEVLAELGRGGMGVVYKARHLRLNRLVALKMILAGGRATPEQVVRFSAEGQTLARLRHPNIVQVYEVGEHGGQFYCVLELVEGGDLAECLAGQPLSAHEATRLVEVVARAVHYAHQQGVVHRDLKPANILLSFSGERSASASPEALAELNGAIPKVADFGIAKQVGADLNLTATGTVAGTPSDMAPEQGRGEKAGAEPAADIYALGAILYALLTGRPPFLAATPLETLRQVVEEEPPPPRRLQPGVPRDLETICLKCLQKDPARRYATALDLAEDLRRFRDGEPIRARPVGRLARLGKWARRRPAVAGLLLGVLLVTALGVGSVFAALVYAVQGWNKAEAAQKDASDKADKLATQLDVTRRDLMTAQLLRVALLIDGEPDAARALLDSEADCPPELRDFAWGYYAHRLRREFRTLDTGPNGCLALAFAPDDRTLATGGWGKDEKTDKPAGAMLRLWDPTRRREVLRLVGHTQPVLSVAWSPDGTLLASCAGGGPEAPGEIKVWEVAARKECATLVAPAGWSFAVAFSPDGRRLALATGTPRGGAVRVWETTGWQESATLRQDRRVFTCVAFSPDGKGLAAGAGGNVAPGPGNVRIWDARTYQEIANLDHPAGGITCLAFAPDGRMLAAGSTNRTAALWDLSTGPGLPLWDRPANERTVRPRHPLVSADLPQLTFVRGVAFSRDGQKLVTASGKVRWWEAGTSRTRDTLPGVSAVRALAVTADGGTLALADFEHVQFHTLRDTFAKVPGSVRGLAFAADDHLLLSVDRVAVVRFAGAMIPSMGLPRGRQCSPSANFTRPVN